MSEMMLKEFKNYLMQSKSENSAIAYVSRIKNIGAKGPVTKAEFDKFIKNSGIKNTTARQTFAAVNAWNGFLNTDIKFNSELGWQQDFESRKQLESNSIICFSDLVFNEPQTRYKSLIVARNKMACAFLYYAGLRVGELSDLKFSDIDWDSEMISVTGKGSKRREIPLNPRLAQIIADYQDELCSEGFDDLQHNYVLSAFGQNSAGQRMAYGSIRFMISAVFKDSGFNMASTHDFRRAFVTHLFTSKVTIEEAKRVTGHDSYGELDHYFVGHKTAAEAIKNMV
jgi:site-specific recombinase XerD